MSTTDREVRIARTILRLANHPTDSEPLELLHDLTTEVVALLPVHWAGVTVMNCDGRVIHVAASEEACRRLENDQIDLGEGPCLDAARTQRPLPLTSLTGPPGTARWPRFAPRARRAGIMAVASVTLRLPRPSLGALNLLMAGPPYANTRDLHLVQALADAVSAALSHQQELADKNKVLSQLKTALVSRVVIEQAKGVLSARLDIDVDEAFTRLRTYARSRRQKLTALSAHVAQGNVPAELLTSAR
ncbi:GAF and ANTAR domain-containing protein [Streptomyces sp. MST-110588]|uniref:ANTAR domain-containing protein n=1 Tax=Streptomyces sp. MST-110588 TaxID=2833628 RepID=UPI001F5C56CD|nr:GAF and ANTAR domain-containing protein [Streptomyces sp. MST-110588]UNO42277.1 GAF and ANTAR domain-containing protein [Streptomyces sp. MST-110588]